MPSAANSSTANPPAKLWVRGDWDAFFGLGTNCLLNILVLTGLLIGAVQMPAELVFGRILPAVGLMLCLNNIYFSWMAKRLASKEGRNDVTALASGPSVPHMFIVVFVVMVPVRIATDDPVLAWKAGLAWVFIESFVVFLGGFIAPWIRKVTPRAALLGTLAGVSIAFIAMQPTLQIFLTPMIGLVCLAIVFAGWFGRVIFPGKIPAGLVAILVGVVIAWPMGIMDAARLTESFSNLGFYIPIFAFHEVLAGFENLAPLLVTAIPFGVYDFIEAMDNVESASTAGDNYSVKEALMVEGSISLLGTTLGCCFTNAVYIGHPGWKSIGGRIGYTLATGALVLSLCIFGLVAVFLNLIPLVAVLPILLYIGLLIGAQAFQETPRSHAPAIVLALIPHFALWAKSQIDNALAAAGTTAQEVGISNLANNNVLYEGLAVLGNGAILTGLILGAITVFIIEHKPKYASAFAVIGAILSYFGFMHGDAIGLSVSPTLALSYLLLAAVIYSFESFLARENKVNSNI